MLFFNYAQDKQEEVKILLIYPSKHLFFQDEDLLLLIAEV